jgi:hypothetical protein
MDSTGEQEFTLNAVPTTVRDCKDIVQSIQSSTDAKSREVLHTCAAALQQRSLELGKRFRSLDVGCKGELPIATVVWFLALQI